MLCLTWVGTWSMIDSTPLQRHQKFLDDVNGYATPRWIVAIVSLLLYAFRTYQIQVCENRGWWW